MIRGALGLLLFAGLAVTIAACAPVRITTENEPGIDLSTYRTYRAAQPETDPRDVARSTGD